MVLSGIVLASLMAQAPYSQAEESHTQEAIKTSKKAPKPLKSKLDPKAKMDHKPYSLSRRNKSGKVERAIASATHWGYTGQSAPHYWGDIKPEYRMCKTGSQQSPIDIRTPHKTQLPALIHDYKPSVISLLNNGNSIQFNYSPGQEQDHKRRVAAVGASTATIKDKTYELKEFHFHSPSEHQIAGKVYPMEMHLTHQDSQGKLMIVGVLFDKGKRNDFLQTLWTHLPQESKSKSQIPHAYINIEGLLPQNRHYYNYMGSLTEPPCTEQVVWNVYADPVEISEEQLKRFQDIYKGNARPIQARNERYILRN